MANVLLIILLIISIILIGLILIQRSEGGALGIGGGGGGGGGLMSGRGTADLVTRATTIFGAIFMLVSLLISISFNYQNRDQSLFDADGAEAGIVQEVTTPEESSNQPLNTAPDSANDTAPLGEDSAPTESNEESTPNPEETP